MNNSSNSSDKKLRRQAEEKLGKRIKNEIAQPAEDTDILRLFHELQVHQVELEMQNEQLMQAQTEVEAGLKHYADLYNELYDFAPVGYFTLSRDGTTQRANLTGVRLLGVERGKLLKQHFRNFLSPEYRSGFKDFLENVFTQRGKETYEAQFLKNDHEFFWAHLEASIENEQHEECRIVMVDITEQKRVDIELQQHQKELEIANKELAQSRVELEAALNQYGNLYDFAPAGYFTLDREGCILQSNLLGARLLGLEHGQLLHQNFVSFISAGSRPVFNVFFEKLLSGQGKEICELEFQNNGADPIWASIDASCFEGGEETRVVVIDTTARKRMELLLQARVRISDFVESHAMDELLQKILDEAESLTGSLIGFAHFLESDQKTLLLQMWSTNTLENMCTAEGKGQHYDIGQAGVWVDCVYTRAPVIHNDYSSLLHRKGLPQGHAPLLRELVVPVLRHGRIVMIMGVGNKPTKYKDSDVQILSQLANLAWDIILRKRAEMLLEKNRKLLTETERMGNVGGWELNIDTKEQVWTEEVYRIHAVDLTYKPTLENGINFYTPASRLIIEKAIQCAIAHGESFDVELEIITAKGDLRWVHAIGMADLEHHRVFGFFQDITGRKQVEEALRISEEKYRTVADFTYDWETWRGPDNTYLYISPSCERVTGHTAVEFIADPNLVVKITHPDDQLQVRKHFDETYSESREEDLQLDFRIIAPDGKVHWISHFCTAVYGENGQWLGRRESNRDITERKLAEDELQRAQTTLTQVNIELQTALAREKELAHTDQLTGTSNRRRLYELAEREFEIAMRYQSPLSVLMFDIDHFKGVNDTFGHAAGDLILQSVTKVASAELRSTDVIGRYGGEEFVIVLPMTNAQQAYVLAERIRTEVAAIRMPTEKGDASVTLSIGIVEKTLSTEIESIEDLIRHADQAMYGAKEAGRNRTVIGN